MVHSWHRWNCRTTPSLTLAPVVFAGCLAVAAAACLAAGARLCTQAADASSDINARLCRKSRVRKSQIITGPASQAGCEALPALPRGRTPSAGSLTLRAAEQACALIQGSHVRHQCHSLPAAAHLADCYAQASAHIDSFAAHTSRNRPSVAVTDPSHHSAEPVQE